MFTQVRLAAVVLVSYASTCCCLFQVIWGDVNPQWGETHNLYVQQRSKAILKLRVIDKNKLMSDVDLGVVMLGLQTLLEKPGRRLELPLKGAVNSAAVAAIAHVRAANTPYLSWRGVLFMLCHGTWVWLVAAEEARLVVPLMFSCYCIKGSMLYDLSGMVLSAQQAFLHGLQVSTPVQRFDKSVTVCWVVEVNTAISAAASVLCCTTLCQCSCRHQCTGLLGGVWPVPSIQ